LGFGTENGVSKQQKAVIHSSSSILTEIYPMSTPIRRTPPETPRTPPEITRTSFRIVLRVGTTTAQHQSSRNTTRTIAVSDEKTTEPEYLLTSAVA